MSDESYELLPLTGEHQEDTYEEATAYNASHLQLHDSQNAALEDNDLYQTASSVSNQKGSHENEDVLNEHNETHNDELREPIQMAEEPNTARHITSIVQIVLRSIPYRYKIGVFILYLAMWFAISTNLTVHNLTCNPEVDRGNDTRGKRSMVVQLSCREFDDLWHGKNSDCGLFAQQSSTCLLQGLNLNEGNDSVTAAAVINNKNSEFYNIDGTEIFIKCPALCDTESKSYSWMPVGDKSYKYESLIVGGGKKPKPTDKDGSNTGILSYPYRIDSFPCAAALHSGLISPLIGGVAKLRISTIYNKSNDPKFAEYPSREGIHLGKSLAFDSKFPYFYEFVSTTDEKLQGSCQRDLRLIITAVNFLFGIPLMFLILFSYDSASNHVPSLIFVMLYIITFWNVILCLDPPYTLNNLDGGITFSELISLGMRRFLPLCFIMYTLWRTTVSITWSLVCFSSISMTSTTSFRWKATCMITWYIFYWVAIMNNITFDRFTIFDRLMISDLSNNKSTTFVKVAVLAVIGIIAVFCVVYQAFRVWKDRGVSTFKKLLVYYIAMISALIVLGVAFNRFLTLRIHHYVLGLALIPGTATTGIVASTLQGLFLGFVVNGCARWGLDSILQTSDALRRNDPKGTVDFQPPQFTGFNSSSQCIYWEKKYDYEDRNGESSDITESNFDGYSLLVNDIEYYRGRNTSVCLPQLGGFFKEVYGEYFDRQDDEGRVLYFRVARASVRRRRTVGDYSLAARLEVSGNDEDSYSFVISDKKGVT